MTRLKRVVSLGLALLSVGVVLLLWLNRWNVYDRLRLRGYQPPAAVVKLATDTTMNDRTRNLFYVYRPSLDDKISFNNHCTNNERTIVLGCYVSRNGIYLYNITDARLQGIVEVTSAHEVLHAAYERLGGRDKKRVDQLLSQAYDKVTDKRIRENIDDYRKNGADITNELHSILGTEIRDLPSELEQYYGRYFTNRSAVVAFSEKYEQAFTERKEQVAAADKKLQELKKQIDDSQNSLVIQKSTLDAERTRLDSLLAAKHYEAYNSGVPGYNGQVNNFNIQVRYIGGLIDEYNRLVAERNTIAVEEGELAKAIDSRPSAIDQ